jgi:cell division transport system permease protein
VKFDYVIRETFANLRRNITLTIAAIVTVAVSLSLFGSTILLGQGVDNVSARWHDGIELIAFLKVDITAEQRDAIETLLDESPEVRDFNYVDLEESREEALRIFERNELMYQKIESGGTRVPDSYRVQPRTSDVDLMTVIGQQLASEPGVLSVTDVSDSVKTVTGMAMFARRREIEVMKLVGATNWFIRVPFMLEGIIQGLVGSALALGAVFGLHRFMEAASNNDDYRAIMEGFVATSSELWTTAGVVLALGIVIGAAGSGWAISRFLRV